MSGVCQGCPCMDKRGHCVKLPGLPWRPQDVGNARSPLREAANKEQNQSKRKKCVPVNKATGSRRSEEHFDIRHGDAEFGVCPVVFWSCCGPVCPHYAPFPSIWNGKVLYRLWNCMLEVCDLLFHFDLQGLAYAITLHKTQVQVDQRPQHKSRYTEPDRRESGKSSQTHRHKKHQQHSH